MNTQNTMVTAQMPISTLPDYNQQQSFQYYEQNPQSNNLQTPLLQEAVPVSTPQKTGIDKLASVEGILISQSIKEFEVLNFCSPSEHHFYVYDKKANQKGSELLKIIKRGSNMEVNHGDDSLFMRFEVNFGCDFACFNQPVADVFLVEGKRVKLGKVKYAFTCCGAKMECYDANDSLRYVVNKSCCQGCRLKGAELTICEPFGEAAEKFMRYPSVKREKKVVAGWNGNFPKDASAADKALLIAATMMIESYEIDSEPSSDNTTSSNSIFDLL